MKNYTEADVVITCKGDSVQEKQPVVLKALTLMYLVGVTTCKNPSGLNSNMNLFHIFLSIYLLYYTE